MKILAIETSCDETAIALLEITGHAEKPEIKVLGNTLLSQIHLHEKYGGVYPDLAKREHQKNLPILLEKTLDEAGLAHRPTAEGENKENPDIDFIAVTCGPGLEPALWTGITFAEKLSKQWNKPIIPVDHMEGHIYSVLFRTESNDKSQIRNDKLELPALALLVSGGHTELVHIKDFGEYEILGRTKDDAVGEAFDKVARMLGLSYPGGPKISQLGELSRKRTKEIDLKFPRPMINSGDLNFSFSGLKTSVLYKLKATENLSEEFKEDVARAFEDACVDVLSEKTRSALLKFGNEVKTLIVAGGVAANMKLAERLKSLVEEFSPIILKKPVPLLTTDNAIMIGIAAFVKLDQKKNLPLETPITASGNLSLISWH